MQPIHRAAAFAVMGAALAVELPVKAQEEIYNAPPPPPVAEKPYTITGGSPYRAQLGPQVGLRLGFGGGTGVVYEGLEVSNSSVGAAPITADVGWRFAPALYVGAYGQYAPVFYRTNSVSCPGGFDCWAHDWRAGLEVDLHFIPNSRLDPYLGLGAGYEWLESNIHGTGPVPTPAGAVPGYTAASVTDRGVEFLNVTLGMDIRLDPAVGLGPYISGFGGVGTRPTRGRRPSRSGTRSCGPGPWRPCRRATTSWPRLGCAAPSTLERATRLGVTPPLIEATLREPLRRTLAAREPRKLSKGVSTAAAVLVPLFERDGEVLVWLVRRPSTMRSHAGQVAFPGGKSDATDASLLDTALREATRSSASRARPWTCSDRSTRCTRSRATPSPPSWAGCARPGGQPQLGGGRPRLCRSSARVSSAPSGVPPGAAGPSTASSYGARPPASSAASSPSCGSSASNRRERELEAQYGLSSAGFAVGRGLGVGAVVAVAVGAAVASPWELPWRSRSASASARLSPSQSAWALPSPSEVFAAVAVGVGCGVWTWAQERAAAIAGAVPAAATDALGVALALALALGAVAAVLVVAVAVAVTLGTGAVVVAAVVGGGGAVTVGVGGTSPVPNSWSRYITTSARDHERSRGTPG